MTRQTIRSSFKHFLGVLPIIVLLLADTPARPAAANLTTIRYVNGATGTDSGNCSSTPCATIGYAIGQANPNDEIQIAAGTYNERITVNKNLTFTGAGIDVTILDGGGGGGVVLISSGAVTTAFNDLTIQHGSTTGDGGGIENYGTLNLSHVKVANNTAEFGGGIDSPGPLTMTDSIISGNNANIDAYGDGGGLALEGSDRVVTLTRVTISGNTASNYSGGIHDEMGGSGNSLTLTNVTISGNTAKIYGAMTNTNAGVTHIINSTIAGNHYSAGGGNGGVANFATISFKNTIIANNQDTNCTIGGGGSTWTSLGNNLDSRNDCAFAATGDLRNTDPLLGGVADNGGPTQTMALGPGSPAIDAGTDTDCPTTDQRGVVRPQGPHCDIGAFEMVEYSISGNAGIAGAILHYTDGTAKSVSADGSGNYTLWVSNDWTGSVTPSKPGYAFTPFNWGYNHVGENWTGQNFTATPVATFADVPISYWAWSYIERLNSAGITGGCGGGNYCPDNAVTRAQMAIFLERGMNGSTYTPPAATGTVFGDVPISYWDAAWIEKLAADGITGGCGGGNYCPGSAVTRAQMAIFLLRAEHGSSYTPPAATGTVFGDIPISYWDAAWIEKLYAEGITGGCGGGNYCPGNPVTRAQMAVFLVRTFHLP